MALRDALDWARELTEEARRLAHMARNERLASQLLVRRLREMPSPLRTDSGKQFDRHSLHRGAISHGSLPLRRTS